MTDHSEHISLFFSESDISGPYATKRSCRRWWNQLARLQRSIFYTCFLVFGIVALYFYVNTSKEPLVEESTILQSVNKAKFTESPAAKVAGLQYENNEETNFLKPPIIPRQLSRRSFEGPKNERQKAVVAAFKYAWNGYHTFAWGYDHLLPHSGGFGNWFGLGLTLVDSLDTLYIMGLNEEYNEARKWVKSSLSFNSSTDVNLFEVTIRVLGGLLSIYHLSGDKLYLDKARELGVKLLPAFETQSGVPFSDINLFTGNAHGPRWSPDSSTSEVTTIQLEFTDLSRATGDSRFEKVASTVSEIVHNLEKPNGLVPIFINPNTGEFRQYATITMGARGDSYYEYLLKQWIQTGQNKKYLIDDYLAAIQGAQEVLMKRTSKNILFVGELIGSAENFKPKMDHLTCYLSGTLALGVKYGLPKQHLRIAEDLLNTCYQMYSRQPTFLAPEITYFNIHPESDSPDMYVKTPDAHNLLRPEFIESLWYMSEIVPQNRTTYQEWGWQIFQAFEKYTKVRYGYSSIANVRSEKQPRPLDKMESFFLAETLKYLYLLFCDIDDCKLSLDEYVINSEAHFLPIFNN